MNSSDKKNYKGSSFLLKGSNGIGILLIHGWTSPPTELLPLAKYLNSLGYTVHAPLLRGHGTEPEDLKGVTWQDWLKDSQEALRELKKQTSRIFVGGISMGGNLAMLLAKDRSVAGIISFGAPIRFHLHRLAKSGLFFIGMAKTYRKKYFPPWVKKKRGIRPAYPYYPVASAKEIMRLAKATEKFLSKVSKPILIMQAKRDYLVSRQSPRIIHNGVKSEVKEIYWVENAYHVFVDSKKVHKKIREFISRIIS
jgi:carboxylesterase